MNRRALGLALGVLGTAPGCKDCEENWPEPLDRDVDESEPPRVRDARFLDDDTVELVFTEALASVGDVDPLKFRLSIAKGQSDEYTYRAHHYCYHYTYYADLSDGLDDESFGCNPAQDVCEQPTVVTALELDGDDPTRLRLSISPPLAPSVCLQSQYADDRGGIFVHFFGSGIPTVEDTSGQRLEDIAPHWVVNHERYVMRDGIFPAMQDWLPIPCGAG